MSESSIPPQWARLAEAMAVDRVHGAGAPEFMAERITALAALGDEAGAQRWREIAERYDRLQQRGRMS